MLEKWFQRKFTFDIPASRFPMLVERLRGVPARVEEKIRGAAPAILTRRVDGTWSAQENIGHLTDLEELHLARIEQLLACATTLRAADLKNEKTWSARHNEKPLADVLREFRAARADLVRRLERWDVGRLDEAALHPRLQTPMRVVDLAFFVAEHDDAHLARVHELLTASSAA
jgi:hypothetical protein